jgi:hypothetical protein
MRGTGHGRIPLTKLATIKTTETTGLGYRSNISPLGVESLAVSPLAAYRSG